MSTEEFLSPKRHASGYPVYPSTTSAKARFKTNTTSTSTSDIKIEDSPTDPPKVGTIHDTMRTRDTDIDLKSSRPDVDLKSSPRRDFYSTSGFRQSSTPTYQEDDGYVHSSYKLMKPAIKPIMG